jgi:hypothetical protein
VDDDKHVSGEPVQAKIHNDRTLASLTPNSTAGDLNPSTNCTNPDRNLSVHDNGKNREQSNVFLVIQGSLVQLNGLRVARDSREARTSSKEA